MWSARGRAPPGGKESPAAQSSWSIVHPPAIDQYRSSQRQEEAGARACERDLGPIRSARPPVSVRVTHLVGACGGLSRSLKTRGATSAPAGRVARELLRSRWVPVCNGRFRLELASGLPHCAGGSRGRLCAGGHSEEDQGTDRQCGTGAGCRRYAATSTDSGDPMPCTPPTAAAPSAG